MRVLCMMLTLLLVASLIAAIANSLQTAHAGSTSFCKPPDAHFSITFLCPKETMFVYFKCCDGPLDSSCCPKFKFWLMVALGCVLLAVFLTIAFTLSKYAC